MEEKRLEYFISLFLVGFLIMIGLIYNKVEDTAVQVQEAAEEVQELVQEDTQSEEMLGVDFQETDDQQVLLEESEVQEVIESEQEEELAEEIAVEESQEVLANIEDQDYIAEEEYVIEEESQEILAQNVKFNAQMINKINEIGDYLSNVENVETIESDVDETVADIDVCRLEELGIEFSCDLNWDVLGKEGEQGAILLSMDPKVSMSFEDYSKAVRFLAQLTKEDYEQMGHYQPGFQYERAQFAKMDAIVVRAFSKDNPDVRHLDYYYIYNSKLFSINFTVEPKNRWDEVKFVIKEVVDSFSPIDQYTLLVK